MGQFLYWSCGSFDAIAQELVVCTCNALESAFPSALDSKSSVRVWLNICEASANLVSISTRSLSYSLVFLTNVSWRSCSCSSRTCRSCFMHSFKAPSRCAARSSVASFCCNAVSNCCFKATASASAFSHPDWTQRERERERATYSH